MYWKVMAIWLYSYPSETAVQRDEIRVGSSHLSCDRLAPIIHFITESSTCEAL
jgi:hypothetical protein